MGDPTLGCEQINGEYFCCKWIYIVTVTITIITAIYTGDTSGNKPSSKNTTVTLKPTKTRTTTENPDVDLDCVDKGSDCPRAKRLCTNPNYSDLMKQECPQTCGFCGESEEDNNEETKGSNECVDQGNDCQRLPQLCNNPVRLLHIRMIVYSKLQIYYYG